MMTAQWTSNDGQDQGERPTLRPTASMRELEELEEGLGAVTLQYIRVPTDEELIDLGDDPFEEHVEPLDESDIEFVLE